MRLRPEDVYRTVEIRTFEDIKKVVAEFDPKHKHNQAQREIPLSTLMTAQEDNREVTYKVDATTRSKSKRDMLVDGLTIIKNRIESAGKIAELQEDVEINGVPMKPAKLGYRTDGTSWVDPLIRQWLGGYRDGILICWKLPDGYTYRYDLFQHKLTRVPTDG